MGKIGDVGMSELTSLADIIKSEYSIVDCQQLNYDQHEYEKQRVEIFNDIPGNLNEQDGYECNACKNRGVVAVLVENNQRWTREIRFCKCKKIRDGIMRMKRSGLENLLKKYRFENFQVTEQWQQTIKEKAVRFSENPSLMFYIGGQSGCGKTMLCTAIARKLLYSGMSLRYVMWRDTSVRLKGLIKEEAQYSQLMDKLKHIDVLYLDDFLKVPIGQEESKPTCADLSLALEIINYRYNAKLITLISSEWTVREIIDFDEALGGRIFELGGEYCVGVKKDKKRNFRIRNIEEI